MDGKENELAKNVDIRNPLWAVIDIYGNVKGMNSNLSFRRKILCFVAIDLIPAPEVVAGSREIFNKYNQQPDKLPIRFYPKLKSNPNFQQIGFLETHGPELELFCMNTVVLRRSMSTNPFKDSNKFSFSICLDIQNLSRPYLFMDFPMTPGDEFYIRILSVDPNYRTP